MVAAEKTHAEAKRTKRFSILKCAFFSELRVETTAARNTRKTSSKKAKCGKMSKVSISHTQSPPKNSFRLARR